MNSDTTNQAYFNLVAAVIADCFIPPKGKPYNKNQVIKIRREFAKNSIMIQMFCDCSDRFDETFLRNKILEYNHATRRK